MAQENTLIAEAQLVDLKATNELALCDGDAKSPFVIDFIKVWAMDSWVENETRLNGQSGANGVSVVAFTIILPAG